MVRNLFNSLFFINTSENLGSQVFWTITFYLVINGMIYLFKTEKIESSLEDLKNSFLKDYVDG